MEIINPEVQVQRQNASEGELVLKEGEKVNVSVLKKLDNSLLLLNINGKTVQAEADFDPALKSFTAIVVRTESGGTALKIFAPLIQFAETAQQFPKTDTFTPSSAAQPGTASSTSSQSSQQMQTILPADSQKMSTQVSGISSEQIKSDGPMPNKTMAYIPPKQDASVQTQQNNLSGRQLQPDTSSLRANTSVAQQNIPGSLSAAKQEVFMGTANIKSQDVRTLPQTQTQPTASAQSLSQAAETRNTVLQNQNLYAQTNTVRLAEAVVQDGKTISIKLPAGAVSLSDNEQVPISIVKMQENGNTLISVKNVLFEVKLSPQVFKTLLAEVQPFTSSAVELALLRLPVESLDQNFVKQQISTFDIENILKAFGKFKHVNMEEMTPDKLKNALKDSGLLFENKLLNGGDVTGDEKFNALLNSDASAKDGITKMQIANMMLAGGIIAFLKTQDENVSDTVLRFKKNSGGDGTVYLNTTFSELGDTLVIIRTAGKGYSVSVKTEKDISELLSSIRLENAAIRWYKFNKQELDALDPKNEISADLGNFEVII